MRCARHNVAVLVGDWTNGDPALGRFIERTIARACRSIYYYAAASAEPRGAAASADPGDAGDLVEAGRST